MFRLTAVGLSITALSLGLAACGGSSSSSSSSGSSSSAAATSAPASSTSATTSASAAPSGASAASTLAVAADPTGQLKFMPTSLTAKAGKVTITFTNAAPLGHNLTIQQGSGGAVVGASPTFSGGSKTLTVALKPGTYTYFCSVPGHRAGGMEGTIKVT